VVVGQITPPLKSVADYDAPGVDSSGTAAPGNSSAPPLPPSAASGTADGRDGGAARSKGHLHNDYTATFGSMVAEAVVSGAHDVVDAGDDAAVDARGTTAAAAGASRRRAAAAAGVSRQTLKGPRRPPRELPDIARRLPPACLGA